MSQNENFANAILNLVNMQMSANGIKNIEQDNESIKVEMTPRGFFEHFTKKEEMEIENFNQDGEFKHARLSVEYGSVKFQCSLFGNNAVERFAKYLDGVKNGKTV